METQFRIRWKLIIGLSGNFHRNTYMITLIRDEPTFLVVDPHMFTIFIKAPNKNMLRTSRRCLRYRDAYASR